MSRPAFQPQLPADPGTPKSVVQRLFDQAGGIKRVAIKLGYEGVAQVYALASPADAAQITYAQVAQVTEPGVTAGAEHLALLAGGTFVPVLPRQEPVACLTADTMKESAEACSELVRALADGDLSIDDARKALPELEDLIRTAVQLHGVVSAKARETKT